MPTVFHFVLAVALAFGTLSLASRQSYMCQSNEEITSLLQVKSLVSTNRGETVPHEKADILLKLAHDGGIGRPISVGKQLVHDNKTGINLKDFSVQVKAFKKQFPGAVDMYKNMKKTQRPPGLEDVVPGFGINELDEEGSERIVEKVVSKIKTTAHDNGMESTRASEGSRILVQLIFGLVYYFLVVSKYPSLDGRLPNDEAKELQQLDAFTATQHAHTPINLLSCCCTGPRAAHTFDKTDILGFWPSCILMTVFPCCTLFYMNAFTDLNEKLGGERQPAFSACLCAFCCSCCLVAQDAESLDLITNVKTECCWIVDKSDEKAEEEEDIDS